MKKKLFLVLSTLAAVTLLLAGCSKSVSNSSTVIDTSPIAAQLNITAKPAAVYNITSTGDISFKGLGDCIFCNAGDKVYVYALSGGITEYIMSSQIYITGDMRTMDSRSFKSRAESVMVYSGGNINAVTSFGDLDRNIVLGVASNSQSRTPDGSASYSLVEDTLNGDNLIFWASWQS